MGLDKQGMLKLLMGGAGGASPSELTDAMAKAAVLQKGIASGDLAGALGQLGLAPDAAQEAVRRTHAMQASLKAGDMRGALVGMGLTPEQADYALRALGAVRGMEPAVSVRILKEEWNLPDAVSQALLLLPKGK